MGALREKYGFELEDKRHDLYEDLIEFFVRYFTNKSKKIQEQKIQKLAIRTLRPLQGEDMKKELNEILQKKYGSKLGDVVWTAEGAFEYGKDQPLPLSLSVAFQKREHHLTREELFFIEIKYPEDSDKKRTLISNLESRVLWN